MYVLHVGVALQYDIGVCDMKRNNYFKDLASKIKCFKNICKSLAYRHQYLVCYQTFSPQSVVKDMQIGRCKFLSQLQ